MTKQAITMPLWKATNESFKSHVARKKPSKAQSNGPCKTLSKDECVALGYTLVQDDRVNS